MRLEDKVVVVAGSGTGMSRAMALLFSQEGAKVVIVARHQEAIDETAQRIHARAGDVITLTGDMTVSDDVERVFTVAHDTYGRIDALCSMAGGNYRHMNDLETVEEEFFDQVLNNHIKSVFHTSRQAIPYLKAGGGGAILTIAAGYRTRRDANIAYGTAKEGVIGFTKNLARELHPHNIRVNCICPGLIRQPVAHGDIVAPDRTISRLGQPEDIAFAALYLISDEASWISGQSLVVDGGDEVLPDLDRNRR